MTKTERVTVVEGYEILGRLWNGMSKYQWSARLTKRDAIAIGEIKARVDEAMAKLHDVAHGK